MYGFIVQKDSKHIDIRCSNDDVTNGMVETVLERMKSQPMLQTNVRRNHISCARKIGIKIVKNRKIMQKKEKILQIHAGFWQGH